MTDGPSRTTRLMRLELAERIRQFLLGRLDGALLVDWAIDHPFFEDCSDLSAGDQTVIGKALGRVLSIAEGEDVSHKATREELALSASDLAHFSMS